VLGQHRARPSDFDLVLVQDVPQHWIYIINMTLLGELRKGIKDDKVPSLDRSAALMSKSAMADFVGEVAQTSPEAHRYRG